MGRKTPKIFDGWSEPEPEDEKSSGSSGARKESSEHSKLSWWAEFEDDRFGGTVSSEGGSVRSDFGSGYYSYRDAFDDSDKSWYRQSSFKYSSYSDYSPSSLFRSSFSSWGFAQTAGNDIKNKAIRALRTLRRNANTVANAAAKINYDVQFSNGEDSNGVHGELSANKQQTIYVSPDELCSVTTADEEDAVVDALTGFVLLRVQISQSVDSDVIRDINALSLRGAAITIANAIRDAAGELSPQNVAAQTVDGYSASILAKSMLMRLGRRAVVEDWGGFAPYFVRHAKQFAKVKENLVKATELSAEGLAARIAYNMAAAEDEIPLDKDVSDIVEKHLGAQLPADKILPACVKLMADLRAYVASKNPVVPADTLEAALAEGLQDILDEKAAQDAAHKEEAAVMREQMEKFAQMLDKLMQDGAACENALAEEQARVGAAGYDAAATERKLNDLRYKDRLLNELKSLATEMQRVSEAPDAPNTIFALRNVRQNVDNNRLHFRSQMASFVAAGVPELPDTASYNELPTKQAAAKQAEDLKEFVKQARAVLKKESTALTNDLKQLILEQLEYLQKILGSLEDKNKVLRDMGDELNKMRPKYNSATDPEQHVRGMMNCTRERTNAATTAEKQLRAALANLTAGSKSFKHVVDAGAVANKWQTEMPRGAAGIVQDGVWSSSGPTQKFTHSAISHHEDMKSDSAMPMETWHAPAIDRFLEESKNGPRVGNFSNHAIKAANEELFEALKKAFHDKETGHTDIPDNLRHVPDDKKAKLESAAESLGMSAKELLKILRELAGDDYASKENTEAAELGQLIKEQLMPMAKENSPIDDGLFGELVEKTTALLDDSSVSQINDEARNLAEEDYVAYLSHSEAKPAVKIKKATKKEAGNGHAVVKRVISVNRAAISRIRESLQFQSTKRVGEVYGLRSGDLDEGSLHKLRYDSEHIWSQKTVSQLPDVAVGILVDQSGSMNSGHKIEQARDMCIILSEAVRKIPGVHLHIYGHTANQGSTSDLTLFEHHSSTTSAENADLSPLGNIRAYSNNYDGYAIKETAKLLDQDPAKRKYLFVIADGLPHGNGYSGDEAEKHVASVCSFVRTRLKIPTYAFAVGVPEYDRSSFESQYGKSNVLFLSRVQQCLPQITRFLRNALQKEKTLVDVAAD
jgi:uncharacterized protein (UPF0147 family)